MEVRCSDDCFSKLAKRQSHVTTGNLLPGESTSLCLEAIADPKPVANSLSDPSLLIETSKKVHSDQDIGLVPLRGQSSQS
jgi:hypothetical protein